MALTDSPYRLLTPPAEDKASWTSAAEEGGLVVIGRGGVGIWRWSLGLPASFPFHRHTHPTPISELWHFPPLCSWPAPHFVWSLLKCYLLTESSPSEVNTPSPAADGSHCIPCWVLPLVPRELPHPRFHLLPGGGRWPTMDVGLQGPQLGLNLG